MTPTMSTWCSNQLSYNPIHQHSLPTESSISHLQLVCNHIFLNSEHWVGMGWNQSRFGRQILSASISSAVRESLAPAVRA